jgi:alkaline phosphatase D
VIGTRVASVVGGLCLLTALAIGEPGEPSSAVEAGTSVVAHDAPLLVTVGDVTTTSAHLWVSAPGERQLQLRLDSPAVSRETPDMLRPDEDGRVVAVLRGLAPGRRHHYRLHGANGTATGEFVTAPMAEDPVPVRLAWSGDLGARGHCRTPGGWPVFDAITERRPDVFIFAGDTIYADHRCRRGAVPGADFAARTLEEFRAKHRYNRADPSVQRLFRRTSVTAIWDDHDVKSNFSGPAQPLTAIGLRAFLDSWPVATPPDDPTRLYRRLRWGRLVEIFVLDTRSYRSQNWRRDGPGKTMLGAAQRRWLVEELARSTATWKVVVSTVSLSIPKGWPFGDSWARRTVFGYASGFAVERDALFDEVKRRGVQRLVVLAADVHFGALMTHRPLDGLEVHELTAGPLAARLKDPTPPGGDLHTTVHARFGGRPTFGELDVDVEGLTGRLFDAEGRGVAEVRWPMHGQPRSEETGSTRSAIP